MFVYFPYILAFRFSIADSIFIIKSLVWRLQPTFLYEELIFSLLLFDKSEYRCSIDMSYRSTGWITDDKNKHLLIARSSRHDDCLITRVSFMSMPGSMSIHQDLQIKLTYFEPRFQKLFANFNYKKLFFISMIIFIKQSLYSHDTSDGPYTSSQKSRPNL